MTPGAPSLPGDRPLFLHEFFERAAAQWPDRPAIDIPPAAERPRRHLVSYADLRRQAQRLADALAARVTRERVAAILLPRGSADLYAAQLGVLKAGAAFTCIDPAFPDVQVREILRDADAVALLTDAAGAARAPRCGMAADRIIDVARELHRVNGHHGGPSAFGPRDERGRPRAAPWLGRESLAYLIYTSGTTGRPKGVMIEHRSAANLVASDVEEFGLTPEDRVAQGSSPSYDSSVEETWLALAAGATVVVMDEATSRLGPDLVPWLRRERITVLCPPPTLLRATGCLDPAAALPDLRLLYVGGEALPADVAERWAPGRRLVNGYGPTECTVTAVRGDIRAGEPVTIGRPVAGLEAWVLDGTLGEVADGSRGELCIGGAGLARGYRNLPDLTDQKFPRHPTLGRLYRTGDLVHRDADGRFYYHGRIDSLVKLRGYRVELEAIEARLAEHDRVRAAACRVQDDESGQTLVAFVVPADPASPPPFDDLKLFLTRVLPAYMVPVRFGVLAALPTTLGGKLDRGSLPLIERNGHDGPVRLPVLPRNARESRIEAAFTEILRLRESPSIHDDFFSDLGGDSLHAAQLVSRLRENPATARITVRDVYEAPSIAVLADRAGDGDSEGDSPALHPAHAPATAGGRPLLATLFQVAWLLAGLFVLSPIAYVVSFEALPLLVHRLGPIRFVIVAPLVALAALLVYSALSIVVAIAAKWVLIGRYRATRVPVWSSLYVRNWMVQRAVRIVPWQLVEGTTFQLQLLRALGARIGRRVHIHRGVAMLQGGWDLLEIGDDVSIGQDASINLVDLDDGFMVVAPVSLGTGATLGVRAGVSGGAGLEPNAYLAALSSLAPGGRIPRGERWDGVPAGPAGQAPPRPAVPDGQRTLSPALHGLVLMGARFGVRTLLALPPAIAAAAFALFHGLTSDDVMAWFSGDRASAPVAVALVTTIVVSAPLSLLVGAGIMRALGRVSPGVIGRWSLAYVRVWLKTEMLQSAGNMLSGALFWPVWLRWAGMRIGPKCEISTIIDVVPELVDVGPETFFADGIYLGGPVVHRGTVTLAATAIGAGSFFGNGAVVPAGDRLPGGVLVGVSTVARADIIRPGTSWFGHPPFELPRREIVACDRRLTHEPSTIRYLNRVFWEALRSTLPLVPALMLLAWFKVMDTAGDASTRLGFLLAIVPLGVVAAVLGLSLVALGLKWLLLGRVRPGIHPLWSCWCSRWDFLFVAWRVYARGPLSVLEGTLLLSWYLRAMGAEIGRGVVLGGGFAQVVDPDMLHFEDGATVSCLFQAHTFEDRVLKIDHVQIRRGATVGTGAVLLYGADVGAGAHVAPHSVIMKRERLLPGRAYAGCPTRPVGRPADG